MSTRSADLPPARVPVRRALALAAPLALAAVLAGAQPVCIPSTTPCQVCPPPPCTPSGTQCGGGNVDNLTLEATLTCTGTQAQTTISVQTIIGPATVCYGPQKAQSCTLCPGCEAVVTEVDSITTAAVLVPTLSLWGLGALAALLGALALRRLSAARQSATSGPI